MPFLVIVCILLTIITLKYTINSYQFDGLI